MSVGRSFGGCGRRRTARLPTACLLVAIFGCLNSNRFAFVGQSVARQSPRRELRTVVYGDNLFDRFARVAKANVNKVLQNWEDPEKVLDQAVDEMQEDLIRVRQSYAEVLATQRRLSKQKEEADNVANEWYRRAELAVEKGDDALAKEALTRRQSAVSKASDLESQIQAMTANTETLFDSVKSLEEKITKAKDEKEQLIARARTAKTTAQVNEMLSDVTSTSGAGAFDRMKEKVEMLETKAEVSQGLLPEAMSAGGLEDRFKQLESGSAVDDELAKLKGSKALPAGGKSALDDELEAMRKKLKEGSSS
eukprot:TRINITY_DN14208_c3_g1_i1.p1 TRINITY_DN14208_c3_g1~~TRINITY_DN14208_c3_g1_i1.p1  ORF type:complete len:330 (+),score=76.05 TRINITY_DN14208_c3_g1_i1:67-990(+)